MATPSQLTQVAFAAGLDESQRAEVLDPMTGFTVLENVRQIERGAVEKRLGYLPLTKNRLSGSRSAGRRLTEYNGAPIVIDGSYLDTYSEAASKNLTRSRVSECTYRLQDLPIPASSAVVHDVEHCNGFVAVTYGYSLASSSSLVGTTSVCVVSATDGSTIVDTTSIGTGVGVTVVGSYGSRYFIAFHYNDNSTLLTAYLFDTQNLATGWTTLATVAATTSNAYPAVCSLSDRVAVVYGTTSGASRVTVKTYNASGVLETRAITASSTPGKLSIDGSVADTLWVAFSQGTAVHTIGLDADVLATTRATDVTALTATTGVINLGICEGATAGTARAWVLSNASPPRIDMCGLTTSAGAAVAGTSRTVYNIIPVSRAFQQGGRYYMAVAPGAVSQLVSGNTQSMCVVADWTYDQVADTGQIRPVANIEPGLAPGCSFFCKFSAVSATKRIYGFQVAKAGLATFAGLVSGNGMGGCSIAELDFGSRDRWLPARHGNSLILGGALTSIYDGASVSELGFLSRPSRLVTSTASGSLTGTFRYVAIRESVDASGNVVVSGISDPSDPPETPSTEDVTVTTATLTVTSRTVQRTVFYRTLDGGEPPYYRLGVGADGSSGVVTFVDTVGDATLATRPKLYAPDLPSTAGDALDRRAPPGLVHVVSYNGMLVGAKGSSLFYSGQEVYGEATWFNPVFEVPVSGGGDITGLLAQDGTLFVFKSDRVFAVSGDAPSDNGLQGGLGSPRLLASDVGCVEPNSIVGTALGIFFQSARGIELLDRNGSAAWIGANVQDTLASFPIVSSAVLDERNAIVRFSLAAAESSGAVSGNGRDVVYDLTLRSWSVDDKTGASSSEASQSAASVYLDGAWRYAWLGTDGTIYSERDTDDASAHLDGSSWVTMVAETGSFKTGGIQGKQHLNTVLVLARTASDHDLSASLAYNYEASFRTARTWTRAEINSLLSNGWPITQLKHDAHDDAECQGVRVRLEDAQPTGGTVGNGKGATWIALTLDITPKPGIFDVPEEAA